MPKNIDPSQSMGYFEPMGLLYQFPIEENELDDRINITNDTLTIRNYGLPMIFWGYLLAMLSMIIIIILAIKTPALKLASTDDTINKFLGYGVLVFLAILPVCILNFYFFDKKISKKDAELTLSYSVFWIPFWSKKISLKDAKSLEMNHFIDSPNVAAIEKKPNMTGFQNHDYHELFAVNTNSKKILVDRNSRRGEIKKLLTLLEKY